jgi:CheY-like chemotaxis protein
VNWPQVYRVDVSPRRRRPILLADDDLSALDGLREFLAQFGYDVLAVGDGQEAMNLLVAGTVPSLLIVDLAMPHLAGSELLKYVQSDPELRQVPVLVVTGSPELLGHAVADAILTKPIDLIALLGHVRRLIARRDVRK